MGYDLKQLEKIFGPVSEVESTFDVFATVKYYPSFTKVFIPKNPYKKKIPFLDKREDEEAESWTNRVKPEGQDPEENLLRSLRNTKTLIADYTLCNEFDLFVTLTIDPKKSKDRNDPDVVKRQVSDWHRNQRKRKGKFQYLLVPERHKSGALHFHGLYKNFPGRLVVSDKKIKGRVVFNVKSYQLGYSTAVQIDNIEKVSSYVRKYITKDMPQFHNQHRFWASKGLRRPRVEDNPADWYLHETPTRTFENEYGVILVFPPRNESHDEA